MHVFLVILIQQRAPCLLVGCSTPFVMHFLNVSTEIVSAPAVATMDAPQVFSLLQLDTLPVSMFAIAIDGAVLLVLVISTGHYLHTRQSRVAS